jgi:hypothetical protein
MNKKKILTLRFTSSVRVQIWRFTIFSLIIIRLRLRHIIRWNGHKVIRKLLNWICNNLIAIVYWKTLNIIVYYVWELWGRLLLWKGILMHLSNPRILWNTFWNSLANRLWNIWSPSISTLLRGKLSCTDYFTCVIGTYGWIKRRLDWTSLCQRIRHKFLRFWTGSTRRCSFLFGNNLCMMKVRMIDIRGPSIRGLATSFNKTLIRWITSEIRIVVIELWRDLPKLIDIQWFSYSWYTTLFYNHRLSLIQWILILSPRCILFLS